MHPGAHFEVRTAPRRPFSATTRRRAYMPPPEPPYPESQHQHQHLSQQPTTKLTSNSTSSLQHLVNNTRDGVAGTSVPGNIYFATQFRGGRKETSFGASGHDAAGAHSAEQQPRSTHARPSSASAVHQTTTASTQNNKVFSGASNSGAPSFSKGVRSESKAQTESANITSSGGDATASATTPVGMGSNPTPQRAAANYYFASAASPFSASSGSATGGPSSFIFSRASDATHTTGNNKNHGISNGGGGGGGNGVATTLRPQRPQSASTVRRGMPSSSSTSNADKLFKEVLLNHDEDADDDENVEHFKSGFPFPSTTSTGGGGQKTNGGVRRPQSAGPSRGGGSTRTSFFGLPTAKIFRIPTTESSATSNSWVFSKTSSSNASAEHDQQKVNKQRQQENDPPVSGGDSTTKEKVVPMSGPAVDRHTSWAQSILEKARKMKQEKAKRLATQRRASASSSSVNYVDPPQVPTVPPLSRPFTSNANVGGHGKEKGDAARTPRRSESPRSFDPSTTNTMPTTTSSCSEGSSSWAGGCKSQSKPPVSPRSSAANNNNSSSEQHSRPVTPRGSHQASTGIRNSTQHSTAASASAQLDEMYREMFAAVDNLELSLCLRRAEEIQRKECLAPLARWTMARAALFLEQPERARSLYQAILLPGGSTSYIERPSSDASEVPNTPRRGEKGINNNNIKQFYRNLYSDDLDRINSEMRCIDVLDRYRQSIRVGNTAAAMELSQVLSGVFEGSPLSPFCDCLHAAALLTALPQKALSITNKVIASHPQFAEAYLLKAKALLRTQFSIEQLKEAEKLLEIASNKEKRSVKYRSQYVSLQCLIKLVERFLALITEEEETDEAEKILASIQYDHESNPLAEAFFLRYKAEMAFKRGNLAEASGMVALCLEYDSRCEGAYLLRARLRKVEGNIAGAISDVNEALTLNDTPSSRALLDELVGMRQFPRTYFFSEKRKWERENFEKQRRSQSAQYHRHYCPGNEKKEGSGAQKRTVPLEEKTIGKRDTLYGVLGVDRNASTNEIRRGFREAALKWHPDKWINASPMERKVAERMFREAAQACELLSDVERRALYDATV